MLKERLGKEVLYFDGGMGTLLQEKGLQAGELPEIWNLTHMEEVIEIHRDYFEAGSDIVLTNTFGANALKFQDSEYELEDIVTAAVIHVKEAAYLGVHDDREVYTALDIGPTGKLLKPMGDLDFEDAYQAFAQVMRWGEAAGADLIHIETMSDTYEMKAAVLAAKEQTSLPVFATMIFDEKGRLLTGADVRSAMAMLEGLGVDALGINCGLGPEQMLPIFQEIVSHTSLPVIVKPNAGLPKQKDGAVYYDVTPKEFVRVMEKIVDGGAAVIGGCCGTTPGHIRNMTESFGRRAVKKVDHKEETVVSSYGAAVVLDDCPVVIGERINPTGKKRLKQALKEQDFDYILKEGIRQQELGAQILDVNVGLPDMAMMREAVSRLQSITSLPLQIDTVDPEALESAMRIYNGKPMVNSVSGKQESMDQVFPLVKKYGGVVVGLTLDESGIPDTAEGRIRIAGKIIKEAEKYGIRKKDLVIDVLTMTVSSDPGSARVTLDALRGVKEKFGVATVLGVSNISFGLPNRAALNANFYTMALEAGLDAGIINPASEDMMCSYRSFLALTGQDPNFEGYIGQYGGTEASETGKKHPETSGEMPLEAAIEKGMKKEAAWAAEQLLKEQDSLSIINRYLIPALDRVGKGFEKGTVFLPQLLMSADAAKQAFSVLKEAMPAQIEGEKDRPKVILATVKGDIHDIGKNIVKVLLENYSFDVLDLGKDVPPEDILKKAVDEDVKLVGLSALMTTTVASMEETIRLLRREKPDCRVMVGGAVLNQEYADMIGADFYGKDAMQSVYYAQEIFHQI